MIGALLWTTAAGSVALYLASGALAPLSSLGDAFTRLGIVAGLLSTNAALLLVALASRIPLIDRTIGADTALRWHRELGEITVTGLALHAVLLTLGASLTSMVSPVATLQGYLGDSALVAAMVALALFVLMGVSSHGRVRQLLSHEVWHGIHLLSVGAVIVSLPHQFTLGLFAQPSWQRTVWLAYTAVIALAYLTFRVFLPLIVTAAQRPRVLSTRRVGPDAVEIEIGVRNLAALQASAGQYIHVRFLGRGLWWHQHPFSLSAAPAGDRLTITVRALGRGSARLQRVRPGTPVMIAGPYGLFTQRARTTERGLVLAGSGIGIAPIRALLEAAPTGPVTVLLRGSRPEELYHLPDIAALCDRRGARLITLVGPRNRSGRGVGWLPQGWEHRRLSTLVPGLAHSDIYVCGPDAWSAALLADARCAGVPETRLHHERFSW